MNPSSVSVDGGVQITLIGSNFISGILLGHLVDKHGWDSAFIMMIICAAGTVALMALTWNVGAHPPGTAHGQAFEVVPAKQDGAD